MFQKQYLHRQYQIPYQQNSQNPPRNIKTPSFSPKIQYTNSQKNKLNSPRYQQNHSDLQNNAKIANSPNDQPSQSYSSYYQQKINMTNSISVGSSYPSKYSRTQKSKDKIKALQQIKEEQQNILKLKKKYSSLMKQEESKLSSQKFNNVHSKDKANKLIRGMNPSLQTQSNGIKPMKSQSKNGRHLKTQFSRDKNIKNYGMSNNESSNAYQAVQYSNTNNNNTYTRSISNSFNPKFYQNDQSQTQNKKIVSPSQQYYSGSYQNNTSSNQHQQSRQLQGINHRNNPGNSRDASTVNTQQRPSSLSLNKFAKKPMLTFYHCEIKKFYKYNDEGYLTDRQIILRQKIEKAAEQALDKMIIQQEEQSQTSKIHKSKSVGHFPKLNKLKEEAEKQRKRKYELYGKYQNNLQKQQTQSNAIKTISGSKQKSYNPSQLPPSSSLSKKKFKVIYKEDEYENILSKNQLNDDSYHDRQQKKKQSHIQQVTQNARSSLIKRNKEKKSKISQVSSQKDIQYSDYEVKDPNNNLQVNQQSPKGISKIGGITSQYMISSNQNVSKTNQESKPSFVQQFSQSSISENYNNSIKNSIKKINKIQINKQQQNDKANNSLNSGSMLNSQNKNIKSGQQKSSSSKKSQNLQNLDMINSNYKKVSLTQNQLKPPTSENGSLKLKTNTDKNSKQKPIATQKIKVNVHKGSLTSQEDFQSESQFVKKQSSNSVKSSHIGLTQELHTNKKSKNSKLSNYGSQSAIQTNLKKKSSLKKWVRQNENENGQNLSSVDINMKKKEKIQLGQSTPNLKSNNQQSKQNQNEKKNRFSTDSDCLNIQSALNLPKYGKKQSLKGSKIQEQSQSSQSEKNKKPNKLISKNKEDQQKQKSSSDHSQGSLLTESQHNVKIVSKISNQMKKSRLSSQRQSYRNKALSHSSRMSGKKIQMKKQTHNNELKLDSQRFGNYLKVNGSQQSISSQQSQAQSRAKSCAPPQQNKQKKSINKSQKSQYLSHHTQQFSNSNENGFNLIERAEQLLEVQDELHEKRRKLQNDDQMTEDFQDVLAKIQAHISTIRQILQIATNAMDIYSQDSAWVFKSCLLSLKKYQLQRIKIVDTLRGKKSCFKVAENQLGEQDLKQFLNDEQIKLLAKDMEYCNNLTQKLIEDFIQFLRQYFGQDFSDNQFNLRAFDDRFDLGVLLEEYKTQILGLKQKAGSSQDHSLQQEQVLEQETQEVIKKRIFKLMQVGFLLSQLAGKRIKEFTQQIDVDQEFDEYYSDYWPYFERIVKTFS